MLKLKEVIEEIIKQVRVRLSSYTSNKVFFFRICVSPMLTNSSLLTGQIVANPEIMRTRHPDRKWTWVNYL